MEKLHHETVNKLDTDLRHLRSAMDCGEVELALSIAKRVRRESTLLVRQLASLRDKL